MNIIIIGTTSAIAQAVAKQYANHAASFFLVARNNEHLKVVEADLTARGAGTVSTFCQDFSASGDYNDLLQASLAALGQIDLLLIAHGTLTDQVEAESSVIETQRQMQINCLSTISLLTCYANEFAKQAHGTIAVIGSVAGDRGRQSNYIYGTAKAALTTFCQGLSNRLQKKDVNVLLIKPGFVDTPMTAGIKKGLLWAKPEKVAKDIIKAIKTKKSVLYTPTFWRLIMFIIKMIPTKIFNRLNL